MRTKRLIDAAVEHVRASARVKTVFGDPVRVDGKTLIPVAKVPAQDSPIGPPSAKPLGVVEIQGTETRFVPFGQGKRFAWIAGLSAAVGLFVGRIFGKRAGRRQGF
ncbi:MAG TPA: hypothetical protein VH439_15695 [Gemmatimonadales bacterium]|jgi:uncharacterized spore protein YtfJ